MRLVKDILDFKGHDVWSIAPDDTVLAAIVMMSEKEIGALLVMEKDRLAGIGDIARQHGLEEVYFADLETLSILGYWEQQWVHIYGRPGEGHPGPTEE